MVILQYARKTDTRCFYAGFETMGDMQLNHGHDTPLYMQPRLSPTIHQVGVQEESSCVASGAE